MKRTTLKLLTKEEKKDIFKKLIDKDISVSELSIKMKYSRTYVYKVLNGQMNFTDDFKTKLKKILEE